LEAQRLSDFARASGRLSAAVTENEVVAAILESAAPLLGASAGVVGLVRGELVEIVGEIGYPEGRIDAWRSFPVDASLPVSDVIRTREPAYVGSAAERDRRWPVDWNVDLRETHALVVLPLVGRLSVLGAVALSFDEDRAFTSTERELMDAIAAQCALALERARLQEAEQRARERTERLQRFTERLAPALTTDDVVDITLDKILIAAHARGATFAMLTPQSKINAARSVGLSRGLTRSLEEAADRHHTAIVDSFRRRAPIWIGNRKEWESRYPASAGIFAGFANSLAVLPLINGRDVFGAVEVLFEHESEFPADERAFLLAIAGQAAQALDRAHAYEEQRHIALTLQERLLPSSLPDVPGARLAAVYTPGGRTVEVGGDFFDAFETQRGWTLVIGDVCGKGVEAAGFTSECRHAIRVAALSTPMLSPAELLRVLNQTNAAREMGFASVACAVINRSARGFQVTAASAGHPPLIVRRSGGLVETLNPSGPLIGIFENPEFAEQTIELVEGDLLLMYTDGVTEARADGELLGSRRLSEAIARLPEPTEPRTALAVVQKLVSDFQEDRLTKDDIAMLALSVATSELPEVSTETGGDVREPAHREPWRPTREAEPASLALLFPAAAGHLSAVRVAAHRWLEAVPVAKAQAAEIVLAINEAVSNAVAHAYPPNDEPRTISLDASVKGRELTVVVADQGVWQRRPPRSDGGRGLGLIERLADNLELQRTSSGTEVRLRWVLDLQRIDV
jgi:serine phosphatase RsbU (regulator of sigma subunit)/anti-sigma regulatory factor (Ser/Thr protein kinase)